MDNVELRIVADFTAREENKAKMIKLRASSYSNVEEKYNSFKNEDLQRRIDSQIQNDMNAEVAKSFEISYIPSQGLDYISFLKLDDKSLEKTAHRAIKIRDSRTENINKAYIMSINEDEVALNEEGTRHQVYKNSDTNINFDKYSIFEKTDKEIGNNKDNGFIISPEVIEVPKIVEETNFVTDMEERVMPQIIPEREDEKNFDINPISSVEVKEDFKSISDLSLVNSENASDNSIDDLKVMLARAQSLRDGVLAAKQERENAENTANAAKEKLSDTTRKFESYCEDLEAERKKEQAEAERLKTETEQYEATINDMLEVMNTTQV